MMYPSLSKSYLEQIRIFTHLQIKGKLKFRVEVAVKNLEKSVDEFLQVDVALALQIHHCKEALTDNTGERGVLRSKYNE